MFSGVALLFFIVLCGSIGRAQHKHDEFKGVSLIGTTNTSACTLVLHIYLPTYSKTLIHGKDIYSYFEGIIPVVKSTFTHYRTELSHNSEVIVLDLRLYCIHLIAGVILVILHCANTSKYSSCDLVTSVICVYFES